MEAIIAKLTDRLKNDELATILVNAGFGLPGDIRRATNKRLKEIDGIGVSQVRAIRKVFPRR